MSRKPTWIESWHFENQTAGIVEMLMPDDSLDRVVESLSQINVNLEGLRVTLAGLSDVTSDHEDRLRMIERWKNNLTPILALITFLLGAVASIALEKVIG